MRYIATFMAALALGGSLIAAPAMAADPAHPTIVELYQSQGCSSCPPAIANINALATRSDVLPLMFAVTYWDALGWKDTFAKPEFTNRQWDYAHAGKRGNVATPQTIVNGRTVTNGGDRAGLIAAIRGADRGRSGPAIFARNGKIEIGGQKGGKASTVWIVGYDPRSMLVPIRAGENGGRTLVHRNVVKSLAAIGSWHGDALTVSANMKGGLLRYAVMLQQGRGGPIIAASRL